MTTATSVKAFVNRYDIRMTADMVDQNPNMTDQNWQADHWKCVFKRGRKQMTTYFSMGLAHAREPEAPEVLDCLASEAAGFENARDFEDWASEYGYDSDSRTAERIFKVVARQSKALRQFLGDYAYEELLWRTDRL